MFLDFKHIAFENFASFIGQHQFSFRKLEPGLHFIGGDNRRTKRLGSNGAGKSTLLNVLTWGLYGRTVAGLRAPDLKPWKIKGTTVALIRLEIDGVKHHIKRTARPNLLTIDGTECDQDAVDRLLRMPFSVFRQTVLYGQKQPLFLDLSNKDKLSLLSDVLDLDRWELRSMKASERARKLERKLTDIEGEIRGLGVSFSLIKDNIISTKAEMKRWSIRRRNQLDELRMVIGEKSTLHNHYVREVTAMKATAKTAAKELGSVEGDLVITREALDRFDKKHQSARTQWEVHQAYIARLKQELARIDKAKLCPTCKQPIEQADRSEHKKELKRNIKAEQAAQSKIDLNPEGREKLVGAFQTARVQAASRLPDYESAKAALAQLQRLKDQAGAQLDAHKRQSQQLAEETNPYKKQLRKLREQRAELKATRVSLQADADKLSKQVERTKPWIKGFKDVRLLTLEEVLTELEISANGLLEDLGLAGWSMHFHVERETKSGSVQTGMGTTITSPEHTEPVKWESWSGGEGQRLRLAGALALSEVLLNHAGIEINLEILDEPSRSLASSSDLIDSLAERAERLQRRILYVDHLAIESSQFASTIMIVKTKEGSRIDI